MRTTGQVPRTRVQLKRTRNPMSQAFNLRSLPAARRACICTRVRSTSSAAPPLPFPPSPKSQRHKPRNIPRPQTHPPRKPPPTLALEHAVERRRTVCRQPCLPWLASGFPGQGLVEALRLVAPKVVEGQVAPDGEQPSLKAAPLVELTGLLDHAQPGLLEEVLRQGRLTNDAQ